MAIRRREDKDRWQVYWRNPHTGKQETAMFKTKAEAEKHDAKIKYRLKYEKDTFAFEPDAKEEKQHQDDSLESIFYMFLQEKQYNVQTLRNILSAMKIPLKRLGRKRIGSITEQDIAFLVNDVYTAKNFYTGKPAKGTTKVKKVKYFFAVLAWAKKRKFLSAMPDLPELKQERSEHFIPPSPEELGRMYAAAEKYPCLRRVIVIGSKLGVRVGPSELFKMRWEHVDFERGFVRIQAAKKNKNEPWREVPIKSSLLDLFRQWKAEDDSLGAEFIIHINGKQKTRIRLLWNSNLKRAGIKRNIRPYDLRHAFATDAIAAGADIGTVAKLMGHADGTMILKHYQHVMTKQKQDAVEALPDIPMYAPCSMPLENKSILQ